MARTDKKTVARHKRIKRIRKKIVGTTERPRLRVFKSARHIYAQIIDDSTGNTLASSSTLQSEISGADLKGKTAQANKVGLFIAEKAKEKGIAKVIFDRGGFIYHGRIKALSEGAREGGLLF